MIDFEVLDIQNLPKVVQPLYISAISLISQSDDLFRRGENRLPLELRVEYTNVYNSHIRMISGDTKEQPPALISFKTRFDIFSQSARVNPESSYTYITELCQIVIHTISESLKRTIQKPEFSHPNLEKVKLREYYKREIILKISKAWKQAVAYSKYVDESIIEDITPFINKYLGMDIPELSRISYPYIMHGMVSPIKSMYDLLKTEIISIERKLNSLKIFSNPDSDGFIHDFLSNYKSIGIMYLTYPTPILKEDELK